MPARDSPGSDATTTKHVSVPKGKKSKTKMTKKQVKASRAAAALKSKATRLRKVIIDANEAAPRNSRQTARASTSAATNEEVNQVFGSDAGSDDGDSEEENVSNESLKTTDKDATDDADTTNIADNNHSPSNKPDKPSRSSATDPNGDGTGTSAPSPSVDGLQPPVGTAGSSGETGRYGMAAEAPASSLGAVPPVPPAPEMSADERLTPPATTAWPTQNDRAHAQQRPYDADQDAVAAALAAACAAVEGTPFCLLPPQQDAEAAASVPPALPAVDDSTVQDKYRQSSPRPSAHPSLDGGVGLDAPGNDDSGFPGDVFLSGCLGEDGGFVHAPQSGSARGGGTAAESRPAPDVLSMAPPDFPPVEDAVLQRKYAEDRLAWRACFSEWGVSWENDVHAEMVELFTRARDVTPPYVIHFALGKVTADAPAARTGLQDWFSRMLSATKQGVDDAVAEPLCRVRRTHVLMVTTAAYTKYGFSLPDSVHDRPAALSPGLGKGDEANVMRRVKMPSGSESSPTALRRGKRKASVAELGSADAENVNAIKTSGKSVAKSDIKMDGAVGVADGSAADAKGRHDRTMVRMMTAVGIMLKYYNPETKKRPSVHDVYLRMHP